MITQNLIVGVDDDNETVQWLNGRLIRWIVKFHCYLKGPIF